jgi:transcriptional regulator with XRE-family HTH domain
MGIQETRKKLMDDPAAAKRIREHLLANHRAVALHELRQGRVTQAELAGVMGISQRRVSAIESARDPRISTLSKYMETLGYTLEISARDPSGKSIPVELAIAESA